MGCEVVALSRSADKEAMAREMGAHEFVNTRPEDGLASAAKFDFVCVRGSIVVAARGDF